MTNQQPGPAPAAPVAYTQAQLDRHACIVCGDEGGNLVPAGHVDHEIRPGEKLGYAVVAHLEHVAEQVATW